MASSVHERQGGGMRVGILGQTVAWDATGRELPLPVQLRALLAVLAVDPGTLVPVDRLVEAVHGDAPPAHARNALQAQISRLRRIIGPDTVEHCAGGYRLLLGADLVDAHRFAALVDSGRQRLESGDPARAHETLARALHLWRGPALADLEGTVTAQDRTARLEEMHLATLELLAEAALECAEPAAAVPRLRELVATHPLRERGWSLLLRALAADGRRAEALAAFAEARELIADELGTDPSPELSEAHVSLLREDPARAVRPGQRALPAQLTSVVGRDQELDRLQTLLGSSRLVTLTGPGGVGKTRLAIEVAGDADPGACFVELSSVADPTDVPRAVGSALGLRLQGPPGGGDAGRDVVVAQLVNSLSRRSLLLVLDNCEHLTCAVAPLLGQLLAECPSLRVIATSRAPLGIIGEALFPVPGLSTPGPGVDADEARTHPAVRLLEDRVALVSPGFTVDEDTVEHAVRICRALDGLPLAIELAAARARSRPLADVAEGLDTPFDLLSAGDAGGGPRHRSLASVIEWSWDLLGDSERELLRRFSVFTGGAAPTSVRAVCDLTGIDELLSGLVDKSLLTLHDGRYRMLSTIRAFAGERLEDPHPWRRRHVEHYLELARRADPHLRGRHQLEWLHRLDTEYPNLRAAMAWSTAHEPARALELAHALATYWWLRGRRHDGAMLCRAALDGVGPEPPGGLVEEFVLVVLTAVTETAEPGPLREHLDAVVQLVDDIDAPPRQPMLTITWARQSGPVPTRRGPLPSPSGRLLDSDPWSRSLRSLSDGLQQTHAGAAEEAEASLLHALEGFRSLGERWGTLKALAEASRFPMWRGEHRRAITMLDEATDLAMQLAATEELAERYWQRAWCRAATGESREARADAARAADVAEATGIAEVTARALAASAEVSRIAGDLAAARAAATRAADVVPPGWARMTDGGSETQLVLGRVAVMDGRPEEALERFRHLLDHESALVRASAVEGLAAVAACRDEGERAAHLAGLAAALRGAPLIGDPDVDRVVGRARTLIGADAVDTAYRLGRAVDRGRAAGVAQQGWSARGQ